MIEFKKYSSIENHFYKDYLDQVREQVPADVQWVVQEKVHGTNTSFLCDGNDVKFAKRTSILEDDEKAYRALKKSGCKVEYFEFPGCGHGSWNPAFTREDFIDWLFKQKKSRKYLK